MFLADFTLNTVEAANSPPCALGCSAQVDSVMCQMAEPTHVRTTDMRSTDQSLESAPMNRSSFLRCPKGVTLELKRKNAIYMYYAALITDQPGLPDLLDQLRRADATSEAELYAHLRACRECLS